MTFIWKYVSVIIFIMLLVITSWDGTLMRKITVYCRMKVKLNRFNVFHSHKVIIILQVPLLHSQSVQVKTFFFESRLIKWRISSVAGYEKLEIGSFNLQLNYKRNRICVRKLDIFWGWIIRRKTKSQLTTDFRKANLNHSFFNWRQNGPVLTLTGI